jgi:Bacteriophage head to tail connecting protein
MAKKQGSTADNISKRQKFERIRGKLLSERASYDKHWRELSEFILPRRSRFFVDDQNQDKTHRSNKIIDSTATRAARTLRSGMHAGITSPARPWFRLTTPDPELAEFGPVKEWLHTVTSRMSTVFVKSNLYNVLPVVYGDMGVFASSAMAVLDDEEELLRCYPYPVGSYAIGVSRRQIVDSFTMEFKMSVRQIVDEFGRPDPNSRDIDWTTISAQVKNLWDKGNYENNIDLVWFIGPNPDYDPEKIESKFKPWISVHWEKGGTQGTFLREAGFDEFPILAPRWEVTGFDWYGSDCPGMTALGDIKALQVMQKRKAQAIEIGINPSLQGPTSLRNQKVSLLPGDMTYVDQLQQQTAAIRPIREINLAALRFFVQDIADTRQNISKAFYEDLFLMLAQSDGPRMTAREVAERHEEKLLSLGPVLERTNDEMLDPLVDRTYAIMDRKGLIPPPPEELDGVKLKVEYISLMQQAQKLVGVSGIDRFLQSTMPLIQIFPEIKHKIRSFTVVDEYGELLGINPKIVVPDEEAQQAAQAEQQQIAQQRQMMQAEQASKAAKNLAGSNLDDDSALKRMIDGAVQG